MKTENTLARNLDFAADKASYDAACKRLLANKEILAWIMKSCIEEYRECSVKDIAEYYIEGEPQIAHTAVNSDERSANGSDTIRGMSKMPDWKKEQLPMIYASLQQYPVQESRSA